MPKSWHIYSEKERVLHTVLLRNDGFSDEAIGTFFRTTKGTCVGFRHRKLPKFIHIPRATKEKVTEKRFRQLLKDETALRAAKQIIAANAGVESPYVHRFGQRRTARRKPRSGRAASAPLVEMESESVSGPTNEETLPIVELTAIEEPPLSSPPPLEPERTLPSEEEVRAAARAAICEAASSKRTGVSIVPKKTAAQELPKRFVAEVVDPTKCRCPMPGKRLGATTKCGASPVVQGGCCAEHAALLFGWKPRK